MVLLRFFIICCFFITPCLFATSSSDDSNLRTPVHALTMVVGHGRFLFTKNATQDELRLYQLNAEVLKFNLAKELNKDLTLFNWYDSDDLFQIQDAEDKKSKINDRLRLSSSWRLWDYESREENLTNCPPYASDVSNFCTIATCMSCEGAAWYHMPGIDPKYGMCSSPFFSLGFLVYLAGYFVFQTDCGANGLDNIANDIVENQGCCVIPGCCIPACLPQACKEIAASHFAGEFVSYEYQLWEDGTHIMENAEKEE